MDRPTRVRLSHASRVDRADNGESCNAGGYSAGELAIDGADWIAVTHAWRSSRLASMPPASWIHRVALTLLVQANLDLDALPDRDRALAAWFAEGRRPEAAAQLDAVDLAVARWLARLPEITRRTYQHGLAALATALRFVGARPVRTLLDAAIARPDELDEQLRRIDTVVRWKAGTVRNRLSALHRASLQLVHAGLAPCPVATERPRDTMVETGIANPEHVEAVDAVLRATAGARAARTLAMLRLAWATALPPRDLLRVRREDLHLQRGLVVIGGESKPIGSGAVQAIIAWLEHRGSARGPLFVSLDGRSGRRRSTALASRDMQRALVRPAREAGVELTWIAVRNGALQRFEAIGGRDFAHRRSGNRNLGGINRLIRTTRARARSR